MIPIQLDLFKTAQECEIEALHRAVEKHRASGEKVRKGTYAEINALKKRVLELEEKQNIIERNICNGKNFRD